MPPRPSNLTSGNCDLCIPVVCDIMGSYHLTHCQILSPAKTEWQLILTTLCGWRRCSWLTSHGSWHAYKKKKKDHLTHWVLPCCHKHLCIFRPKSAIQMHYYYYNFLIIILCACHIWLKFVGQFLRYLAEKDFCDLFRVTLTFDLLIPKANCFIPWPMDHLYQFAPKLVHSFSKYRVHKFGNRWTDRHVGSITPPSASLAWWGGGIKKPKI